MTKRKSNTAWAGNFNEVRDSLTKKREKRSTPPSRTAPRPRP